MSGILLQSSIAPHVRQSVIALDQAGLLDSFYTTLYWQRFPLNLLCQNPDGPFLQRLQLREVPGLSESKVKVYPWWELARQFSRFSPLGEKPLTDWIWETGDRHFDAWAAKKLGDGLDFVYGYDHGCLETFRQAQKKGMRRIYEMPAPAKERIHRLIHQELEKLDCAPDDYIRRLDKRIPERASRCRKEWDLADHVIVNSEFTRQTYQAEGYNVDKVSIIPLGAPEPDPEALQSWEMPDNQTLRLLWAGPFSLRKGAHYVLETFRDPRLPASTTLEVYGTIQLPKKLLHPLPANIRFHGPVPQPRLFKAMMQSDALLLPSLADGFGMVVSEALSLGLPVLTTPQVGAASYIENGVSGFLFPSGHKDPLMDAIQNFRALQADWPAMRRACQKTATTHSWASYHEELTRLVRKVLGGTPTGSCVP